MHRKVKMEKSNFKAAEMSRDIDRVKIRYLKKQLSTCF